MRSHQSRTEIDIPLAIPYIAQGLLRSVAQRKAVVAVHGERRDATRQRAACRGKVHQRPWSPAKRPRLVFAPLLDAGAGLGCARRIRSEEHTSELQSRQYLV